MHSLVISFLGCDCPGVVSAVSTLFEEANCDIVGVSQTISNGEFAAIFTVIAPNVLTVENLHSFLVKGLAARDVDLSVIVRPVNAKVWGKSIPCSPFVVTAHGPNSVGLMAALASVFANYGVNIEHLKAIMDEGKENQALFVFEVMVPDTVDLYKLRDNLHKQGQKFSLQMSIQHKDIFEAMHRIAPM